MDPLQAPTIWAIACLALLTIIANWILNIRVPLKASQPWKLRMIIAQRQLFMMVGVIVEYVMGVESAVNIVRKLDKPLPPRSDEDVKVSITEFDGVPVQLYVPRNSPKGTGILYFHGGGWALGNPGTYDHVTREICKVLGAVVVSVDYRKTPKYIYPAQLEDCEAAFKHFIRHCKDYGVNPNRVALTGDSAGGNLVAALTLKLRDTGYTPMPKLQVMLYPPLQSVDMNTPSYSKYDFETYLRKPLMTKLCLLYTNGKPEKEIVQAIMKNNHTSPAIKQLYYSSYLNIKILPKEYIQSWVTKDDQFGDEKIWNSLKDVFLDPYFAPLFADDLSNLPSTYIMTMEDDLIRDDGFFYADRLRKVGNDVTHAHFSNAIHNMVMDFEILDDARHIMNSLLHYMAKRL